VNSAPQDCPAVAGDGFCTHNETASSTPQDCAAVAGDGFCTHDETCGNPVSDCGVCAAFLDDFESSLDLWNQSGGPVSLATSVSGYALGTQAMVTNDAKAQPYTASFSVTAASTLTLKYWLDPALKVGSRNNKIKFEAKCDGDSMGKLELPGDQEPLKSAAANQWHTASIDYADCNGDVVIYGEIKTDGGYIAIDDMIVDDGRTPAVCGNNSVEGPGEDCDDGNTVTEECAYGLTSCTVCDASCTSVAGVTAYCGDGFVDAVEDCDDGNAVTEVCAYGESSCTVCDANCAIVAGATASCGDNMCSPEFGEDCGSCEVDCGACPTGAFVDDFEGTLGQWTQSEGNVSLSTSAEGVSLGTQAMLASEPRSKPYSKSVTVNSGAVKLSFKYWLSPSLNAGDRNNKIKFEPLCDGERMTKIELAGDKDPFKSAARNQWHSVSQHNLGSCNGSMTIYSEIKTTGGGVIAIDDILVEE
jgi:hypothetical protein